MIRLRKKRKKHRLFYISLIIVLGLTSSFFLIQYFSNRIVPLFLSYAEIEARKIATLIMTETVKEEVSSGVKINDLFDIKTNPQGEIQLISFNAAKVTEVLNTVANTIWYNLKALEEGKIDILNISNIYDKKKLKQGIIYEIPFGTITNSILLSNLGPKIPVRLTILGNVISNIETSVEEYGINNVLLKVNMNITVNMKVNLPFVSEGLEVVSKVPLAIEVIQGQIPNFYYGGFKSYSNEISSSLALQGLQ